jgi:folate-binding Fe-S cluster repair protein YgfZ
MVATTNIPGSSHFAYFVGTKALCEAWIEERTAKAKAVHQGAWYSVISPAQVKPNSAWRKERYRDGSPVIPEVYGK